MPRAGKILGREEWGVTANGYRFSFGDVKNVLKLDSSDGCTTLNTHTTPNHFKWVNFMAYEIYFSKAMKKERRIRRRRR